MIAAKMVYRSFIVLGAVALTCAPAALAVSGSSLSGSAAQAEYGQSPEAPTPTPTVVVSPTPTIEVEPTATSSPGPDDETDNGGPGGTNFGTGGPPAPTTTEQGATGPASLPFTGGPVLPLLLAGAALLAVGAVLRRSTGRSPSAT